MKKTLIASAIAAATISGTALAQESNLPTVYGNIQYVLTHTNVDGAGSDVEHSDNGSTLGVKHDHEIAPGITGFFKLELEGINADDKANSNGIDKLDEAYIGVKGDGFGQVWVGSDDSMYESAIDEIYNFYEVGSNLGGNYDTGEGDLIQYLSPSFGGLTIGAAVQVNGDSTPGGKSYPYQLAAMYTVDALELAFAMDSNDGTTEYSSNSADINNENTYGLRASFNLDDLRLTASYETRKDVADVLGLMGVYTLGANQFALSYQLRDNDVSGDKDDTLALQALHNLSDNMYVYVEGYLSNADNAAQYTLEGNSGDERTIAAVGAVYYF
ncbi:MULTISPECIES: porin [unclassified Marinobacter]|uniref:porin n=1 Tax=unclassified Marinobacter TaxID=83889 RepID=UPI0026E1B07C|nr:MULTISPECIES: porin [unclassified Marinobacter]MDO6443867.1 porin [Marinobacter sp. 2_MG-2023]MDO6825244.1 porin [Marinobacter sp. 1_MG-2023]